MDVLSRLSVKRPLRSLWVVGVALASAGAFASDDAPQAGAAINCDFAHVRFATDFDTGRLARCEQTDDTSFRLHLRPENTPINPSPWYAFRIEPKEGFEGEQTLTFTLVSHKGPARYQPKISFDKQSWAAVPFSVNENRMRFSVNVAASRPLFVAGQEIIDDALYQQWLASLPMEQGQLVTLGESAEGRALRTYQHHAGEGKPWLVLIGRQHPPEVTGALAFLHFSEELLRSNEAAFVALRERFNILLAPNMNPDGVARGNWRHTSNGVDLNRDWRVRNEPESQQLHAFLQAREAAGEEIFLALDFHSTHYDIFYTMPADYAPQNGEPLAQPQLVDHWLTQLGEEIEWEVKIKPGHNPNSGVFKQYIADNFAVHGVTYEVGDNTPRSQIAETARAAASTLAKTLE